MELPFQAGVMLPSVGPQGAGAFCQGHTTPLTLGDNETSGVLEVITIVADDVLGVADLGFASSQLFDANSTVIATCPDDGPAVCQGATITLCRSNPYFHSDTHGDAYPNEHARTDS